MSNEALNKIIKEVQALTPDERRQLIERLADPSRLNSQGEKVTADSLLEWLNNVRDTRAELPLTSDSVDILRELREVRRGNEINSSLC